MKAYIFIILLFLNACLSSIAANEIPVDYDNVEDLFAEEDKEVINEDTSANNPGSNTVELDELEEMDVAEKEQPASNEESIGEELSDLEKGLEDDSGELITDNEEIEDDELEGLKDDIGELLFDEEEKVKPAKKMAADPKSKVVVPPVAKKTQSIKFEQNLDVGAEEKELLEVSQFIESKIADNEWGEIAKSNSKDKYIVQEGDYLWKISQRLFGSGFYYAKIWSLNPYITNPHQIDPGMVLTFNTGDEFGLPEVSVGGFENEDTPGKQQVGKTKGKANQSKVFDLSYFGDDIEIEWLKERQRLLRSGTHIQYSSEETYDTLLKSRNRFFNKEYEKYTPENPDILVIEPDSDVYDSSGFDRNSRISFNFKEGFFLNSFITSNVVQDLGYLDSSKIEKSFLTNHDVIYVKLDTNVKVAAGEKFSLYRTEGKVRHPMSDRNGFRYTIVGQIQLVRPIENLWEATIVDSSATISRDDRITIYTPKLGKIFKTFNSRKIEAALIDSYKASTMITYGDVIYLDRGRADGVELGNVFEIFGNVDDYDGRKITKAPTFKLGEVAVISLSDNFSTALVTLSKSYFDVGTIAYTKSPEAALSDAKRMERRTIKIGGADDLKNIDVEMKVGSLGDDLLEKAKDVQLTDEELDELERMEREKTVIKESEKDIKELNRLEREIEDAEALLNEAKVDEDQYLEQQNLDEIEQEAKKNDPDAIESLDEIEEQFGKKYLDEDLKGKENPYGLSEYDIEEIDELLNSDLNDSE